MNNPDPQADHDPHLTRLFANQNEALPANDFLPQLVARLEREQRRQRVVMVVSVIAILTLAAMLAPWIAPIAASVDGLVALILSTLSAFLASPVVLLVLGALALAFLPPIVIWRYWRG